MLTVLADSARAWLETSLKGAAFLGATAWITGRILAAGGRHPHLQDPCSWKSGRCGFGNDQLSRYLRILRDPRSSPAVLVALTRPSRIRYLAYDSGVPKDKTELPVQVSFLVSRAAANCQVVTPRNLSSYGCLVLSKFQNDFPLFLNGIDNLPAALQD